MKDFITMKGGIIIINKQNYFDFWLYFITWDYIIYMNKRIFKFICKERYSFGLWPRKIVI